MAVGIARRVELVRVFEAGVHAAVAAEALVEVLRTDQLPVAHRCSERLTGNAPTVPTRDLLEHELAVLVAVGEARALRPDAGVDYTHDDALPCATLLLACL